MIWVEMMSHLFDTEGLNYAAISNDVNIGMLAVSKVPEFAGTVGVVNTCPFIRQEFDLPLQVMDANPMLLTNTKNIAAIEILLRRRQRIEQQDQPGLDLAVISIHKKPSDSEPTSNHPPQIHDI